MHELTEVNLSFSILLEMKAFKTKWFKKWADKNKVTLEKLSEAIDRLNKKSGIVDLGSNVYKVRIAKNKGKSGGYRTILIYKKDFRCLFVYGFGKNEQENIPKKQLEDFKKYSQIFLDFSEGNLKGMLDEGSIFPLEAL